MGGVFLLLLKFYDSNFYNWQLTKICWHFIAPLSTPDFLGEVSLNLAFGLLLPFTVIRLYVGDLHAVGRAGVHEHL